MGQAPPDWSKDGEYTYEWEKANSVSVEIRQVNWGPDQYDVHIIDKPVIEEQITRKETKSRANEFAEEVMKEINNKHLDILQRRSSDKPKDKDFNPSLENTYSLAVKDVADNY